LSNKARLLQADGYSKKPESQPDDTGMPNITGSREKVKRYAGAKGASRYSVKPQEDASYSKRAGLGQLKSSSAGMTLMNCRTLLKSATLIYNSTTNSELIKD